MNTLMKDLWNFAETILSGVGGLTTRVLTISNSTLGDLLGSNITNFLKGTYESNLILQALYPNGLLTTYLDSSIVSIIFGASVGLLFGLTVFKWVWRIIELVPIIG